MLEMTIASLAHAMLLCFPIVCDLGSHSLGDVGMQVKEAIEQIYAIMCECRTQPPSAVLQVLSTLLEPVTRCLVRAVASTPLAAAHECVVRLHQCVLAGPQTNALGMLQCNLSLRLCGCCHAKCMYASSMAEEIPVTATPLPMANHPELLLGACKPATAT